MDTIERFEKHNEEYLKFGHLKNKRSNRPDLHAFLLLDELFPEGRDMVAAAEHDEIWLDVDEAQAASLTDEQIIELVQCGVSAGDEGLIMFA